MKKMYGLFALSLIVVLVFVAAVQVIASEMETYRLFFPSVISPPPHKGVGGSMDSDALRTISARWYHHWSLCKPVGTLSGITHRGEILDISADDTDVCVDVSKGHWVWDDPPDGYGEGPDKIDAALTACRSGWFMFGDEWEHQDDEWCDTYPEWCWPMSRQIEEAHWYIQRRASVNPDCKLAFGGILIFHPSYPGMKIAKDWVPAFYDAYVAEYGVPPDIDALVFDDYYWDFWFSAAWQTDWDSITWEAMQVVEETYGTDIEIWAREVGSLMGHDEAVDAMERLHLTTQHYDRYAWFISKVNSPSIWEFCALWIDGVLTDLGEMYKEPSSW